jgi:tetratricopeptide (TPR) repeat protein
VSTAADLRALVEVAQLSLRNGRLEQAEEKCLQALARDPKNLAALAIGAEVATRLGRTATAIGRLRKLLDLDPGTWEAHNTLCQLLLSVGDTRAAIEVGKRACQVHPTALQLFCTLGQCLIVDWQYSAALDCYDRAIELHREFAPAHHSRGIALRLLGRDSEAEAAFRNAARLAPGSPLPFIHLTKLFLDHGRDAEAAETLATATAATNRNPAWRAHFASGLIEIGLHAQAEEPLRDALGAEPNSADALNMLGKLMQQLGRFSEAIECFEQLVAKYPGEARAYVELAQCRKFREGDRSTMQAMAALLENSRITPAERRQLNYALGKAHDDLGEYEAAFHRYKAANDIAAHEVAPTRVSGDQMHTAFDHLIDTFTPEFFAAHRDVGSLSDAPILILGMIRSGTTLIEQILSSHPKVAAGGELPFLLHRGEFQEASGAVILAESPAVRDAYLQLLDSIRGSKPFVTDKMPDNFRLIGLFHLMFPKGRIVHCRRNPADTCLSIYVTPFRKPISFAHDPELIRDYYREYLRLMAHWEQVLPSECLYNVDYEAVVSNREAEVRKLLEFCGLAWNDACLHHEDRGGAVITPSTWQVRQPIYTSSIGRWEHYAKWLPEFGQISP